MRLQSWLSPEVMKQVHSLRGHFETRAPEEGDKGVSSYGNKNGLVDGSNHGAPSPSLAAWHHESPGPSHTSGTKNGFQGRYNVNLSMLPNSFSEDGQAGDRSFERAAGLDSGLSLAIPTARENTSTQPSGFGSPLPTFFKLSKNPPTSAAEIAVTMHQKPIQGTPGGGAHVGGLPRPSQSYMPGRPPTAQLTIFYSGMVNVYDDVPADKAQAIMLLAGSGSSWSSNVMSPPQSLPARPASTGGMASSSSVPASLPAPSSGAAVLASLTPGLLSAGLKPQLSGRPTPHAELPQARKASLARFLEKRKDRVRGKNPYVPTSISKRASGDGLSSPSREKSPSPSSGKQRARSPSPVNAGLPRQSPQRRSPSPVSKQRHSQSSGGSAPSSPTRSSKPPHVSEEQQLSAVGTPGPSNKEEQQDWGAQQAPTSLKEEQAAPEEDRLGSPAPSHQH